ncbi:hypothetical protein PROFUN_01729 [Planoprotostelium fungivorum]|uniref:Uncharacterized protein n=1 Tax=Planoprotostelium fungivorum TaxID=1890364 RepID=A0A2P6MWE6_9EUKA|nr:hypothetical protein PROFUN_01729 [Planoprotostelium fungivorum]
MSAELMVKSGSEKVTLKRLITPRQLRRQLEELLVLEDGCLDENKEQLSELVQKELVELHRARIYQRRQSVTPSLLYLYHRSILTDKEGQSYVNLGSNALRVTAKRLNGEKVLDIRKFERDGISKEDNIRAIQHSVQLFRSDTNPAIPLLKYTEWNLKSDQAISATFLGPYYRSQGSLSDLCQWAFTSLLIPSIGAVVLPLCDVLPPNLLDIFIQFYDSFPQLTLLRRMSQPPQASTRVWLVTGSNRGIGLALVSKLSERTDAIIFAAARDPTNATELKKLSSQNPNFHLVKISAGHEKEIEAAVVEIEKIAGHLDYVIANAGLGDGKGTLVNITHKEFDDHVQINAWGNIILFQKVHRLLVKRPQSVFASMSSVMGSNGAQKNFPPTPGSGFDAYGISKAVINWTMSRIAIEHKAEGIITLSIHPGTVMTDMLRSGIEKQPKEVQDYMYSMSITPEKSAVDVLSIIDRATPEQSGKFYQNTGEEMPF